MKICVLKHEIAPLLFSRNSLIRCGHLNSGQSPSSDPLMPNTFTVLLSSYNLQTKLSSFASDLINEKFFCHLLQLLCTFPTEHEHTQPDTCFLY